MCVCLCVYIDIYIYLSIYICMYYSDGKKKVVRKKRKMGLTSGVSGKRGFK